MTTPKDALVPAASTLPAQVSDVRVQAFRGPAGGPGAVVSAMRYAAGTSGVTRGARSLLAVNQEAGFDCPGCVWARRPPNSHAELALAGTSAG